MILEKAVTKCATGQICTALHTYVDNCKETRSPDQTVCLQIYVHVHYSTYLYITCTVHCTLPYTFILLTKSEILGLMMGPKLEMVSPEMVPTSIVCTYCTCIMHTCTYPYGVSNNY